MRASMSLAVILGLMAAVFSGIPGSDAAEVDTCECVPYYQCSRNNTIVTTGSGIIDRRTARSVPSSVPKTRGLSGECECECGVLELCCKPAPDVLTPEDQITPKPTAPVSKPPPVGCGRRNPDGIGPKKTGLTDSEAQFGEFPWTVAILLEIEIDTDARKVNKYQCGGALIHKQAVLTAAECVNGKPLSELKIRAGEWDTQTRDESYPHQDREAKAVIVHEKFDSLSLHNDIAIVILKTPVDIDKNVDIVCLPQHNEVFDGSRCIAGAWGKDMFGGGRYSPVLKKVDLPIVPFPICQSSLRETRLGKYFNLDPSFICAGGEAGKDTCTGDGGSPLVCPLKNDPSRYAQVGIVSWGIKCGEDKVPGVYANVAKFRQWIDDKMAFHKLDTTVY